MPVAQHTATGSQTHLEALQALSRERGVSIQTASRIPLKTGLDSHGVGYLSVCVRLAIITQQIEDPA
jgi:hypothetical protein